MAYQLMRWRHGSDSGQEFTRIRIDALPKSIQASMPGLKETYVSGYLNPKATNFSTISGFGELAIVREGE